MIYDTRKFQSDVPERRSLESGILPGSRPTWTISSVNTPITGGSSEFSHPFKLSTLVDGSTLQWKVSSTGSTVMDGINGDMIDLGSAGAEWASGAIKFGVATTITASKLIVLQADVAEDTLEITDWTLAAVDDAEEVGIDEGPPPFQNKIRLLIGKVTVDTSPDPDTATATQACYSAQRIVHATLNGVVVKVFEDAPVKLE